MSRKIMVHQVLDAFVGDEQVAEVEVDQSDVDEPQDVILMAYEEAGTSARPGEHRLSIGEETRDVVLHPDQIWDE